MRLLSGDLATTTGLCKWEGPGSRLALSHFVVPDVQNKVRIALGPFLLGFTRAFEAVLIEFKPDAVIIEAPVLIAFGRRGSGLVKDNMAKVRKTVGMGGIAEMLCARHGVPCYEVQPTEVKQMLTGMGNADKDSMNRAAEAMGFNPAVHDEADALGIMMCGAQALAPDLFNELRAMQANAAWVANSRLTKQKATVKREKKRGIKAKGTLL